MKARVKELGFVDGATAWYLCEAAEERGLFPCSSEAALQLRRQYPDQPQGECLCVIVAPRIPDGYETLRVGCSDGYYDNDPGRLWLDAGEDSYYGEVLPWPNYSGFCYPSGHWFVFEDKNYPRC